MMDIDLIKKHKGELDKPERRLKLQKIDDDTNALIDNFRAYLFSIGYRATREKAWLILQKAHKLPYEHLIEKNKGGIYYQGQGKHISSKHGDQLMVVRELGRFEVKAVSDRKEETSYSSVIKFKPSQDLVEEIKNSVPVLSYHNDKNKVKSDKISYKER